MSKGFRQGNPSLPRLRSQACHRKLDRLSRDAHFLIGLQKADVRFVAADMPEANEMVVGIMAVIAQGERKMISQRTKAALAAAKARGTKLGGFKGVVPTAGHRQAALEARQEAPKARATDLSPIVTELRAQGIVSLGAIARALTEKSVPTVRGGSTWTAMQVSRVLDRSRLTLSRREGAHHCRRAPARNAEPRPRLKPLLARESRQTRRISALADLSALEPDVQ